ncbi:MULTISPECIES: hypothetical protein [unclassified Micromonospora]|uniref:hypothetical protein n=1 Tax=unclassified Micromonospora TaxID=2617518 RepID=UPI00104EB5F8|nr:MULTISPECIES: hypothetical protein [unclassified Micromonospora]TDB69699.1 hypothetical protein E1182_29225 [Micromonospora sp. KC721]TDC29846.1 hypothetical protein E1166_29555 [Micromonospora sp. KC213]
MSVGEVKATLGAAVEAMRQGRRVLDQAVSQAESATGEAAGVLRGGQHEEVTRIHQALASAAAEVAPIRRRFDAAAEKIGDYLSRLG